ncbi:putative nuclease HARBI1 isoform X1 [Haliotis rufescens]|uniref:putative nuclease HARBI1 isoform X1 n=1 Tax=Haliotis rufescens TaxID=6454 RepID=UPI00201ED0F8|nr:putative nuclease HARBI1 isoform X1 [Haliotis rufescens]
MAAAGAPQPHQLRTFRPRKNIFSVYSDTELIQRFRLDCAGILFVTNLIRDRLTSPTQRNNAITPEMKIAVMLRYLATGKMQLCNADDLGLSQPSISRIVSETIDALSTPAIVRQFVKLPVQRTDIQRNQAAFMAIAGFPGVFGVIDGTHVRIIAPSVDEPEYVCRKHFHSINVQIVFDAHYNILDIVAKWPGSTHDARILNESGVRTAFEQHFVPQGCHLLGDSGYPSRRWLLTPYLRPQPGPQTRYNRAHKRTRCVVERGIGQLKRRFHVLHSEVRLNPVKVCKVVIVCAILHNICKQRNILLPGGAGDDDRNSDDDDDDDDDNNNPPNHLPQAMGDGRLFRENFANIHFQTG